MMRALVLTLAFCFAVVTASTGATRKRSSSAGKGKPNVLFILVDDLNDWVGWLGGHPQARTPHMDRLAALGMRFTNTHTAYALCNPSRTALLTGMAPWKSGVYGNEQDWRRSVQVQGKPTLPEAFKAAGYTTAAGGKVFHANHGGPESRLTGWHGGRRGFEQDVAWDQRFPEPGVQIMTLPAPTGRNFNGLDIWHWDWGGIDVPEEQTDDAQTVAWAADFLKARQKKPFFLTVGIYRPHSPWYVPKAYFEDRPLAEVALPQVKEDDLADVPEIAKTHAKAGGHHQEIIGKNLWHDAVRAYLANITFADAQVGKLITALEQSPHAQDTIVCLTSDHGWYLGEKQMWHKGKLWERATHVPLTILAPGVTMPDTASDQPVSLLDLYPTLLDLAKIKPPEHLDGETLMPLLKEPTLSRTKPAITTMGGEAKASYSARSQHWRYIRYHDGSEELYDHRSDPNEWTNLAQDPQHATTKAELAAALPTSWQAAARPATEVPRFEGLDRCISYALQPGDHLDADAAPQIAGHGIDLEVDLDYRAAVDQDSSAMCQGNAQTGWALHFIAGKPSLSVYADGQRKTASLPAATDGRLIIRAQLRPDGIMSLAEQSLGEIYEQSPLTAGFPIQPKDGLRVAESFGPLTNKDFPNSTPFDGNIRRCWLTLLPR